LSLREIIEGKASAIMVSFEVSGYSC